MTYQQTRQIQVVVIGAGMIGSTIAARLAQRGAAVTLVDQGAPGAGTSSTSYAWVNSNGKEPESYFQLNLAGLETHHKLAAQGGRWLQPTGHVEIAVSAEHDQRLRERMDRLVTRGYAVEQVSAARARDLLPDVQVPIDARTIAFFAKEAHVFPALYVAQRLGEAREAGVRVRPRTRVVGLRPDGDGGALTFDDGSTLRAEVVVCAVGRWTEKVAALAGARAPMAGYTHPGDVTVGYLLETDPVPARLDRLVTTQWLNVRPDGGGRLLMQALDLDESADPEHVPATDSALAMTYLERLRALVPAAGGATVRRLVVGRRAMPADGHTIVGPLPDLPWLYAVATHSGVTLAPFLGDAVTAEIFGEPEARFADYRPDRFRHADAEIEPTNPRRPGEQ